MEEDIQKKSRTQKKKEADALQNLGLELAALPVAKLKRMTLPKALQKALIEGKAITSNVAGRRHRQYIGVLMRDVDPEAIRLALVQAGDDQPSESQSARRVRIWMERLLAGDSDDMEALLSECPDLERQKLRQLVRNAKKEKAGKGKASKSRKSLEEFIKVSIDHNLVDSK